MKGCFFNIIKGILSMALGFFLVLFLVFGGFDYIKGLFNSGTPSTEQSQLAKAMKIADFSRIGKDFEIVKTVDVIGANAVVANHKPTGQKIGLINTGLILNLTKQDIKADSIEQQLTKMAKSYENNVIKIEKLAVTKKGSFKANNQEVPYARLEMKLQLPAGLDLSQNAEGMIGVMTNPKGQNTIIVGINKYGTYNQKVTEKFIRQLRYNK